MYCVNCKKKTDTDNPQYLPTKNNKIQVLVKGMCMICKKTKTSFVPKDTAKKGGFIFTTPTLLAGLGAAGSLAGGAAAIASVVNKKKTDDKLLLETKRYNEAMESKKGSGLWLTTRKKTCG